MKPQASTLRIEKLGDGKVASKEELVAFLKDLQEKKFRQPDSDWHEYCADCHCSPYDNPPHKPNCRVMKLEQPLGRRVQAF